MGLIVSSLRGSLYLLTPHPRQTGTRVQNLERVTHFVLPSNTSCTAGGRIAIDRPGEERKRAAARSRGSLEMVSEDGPGREIAAVLWPENAHDAVPALE